MEQPEPFEHFLNDTPVEEPRGWKDFKQIIERDENRRFIALKYEGAVTFYGDGFEYLANLRQTREFGFCGLVSYRVYQNCGDGITREAFSANILLTEIEWNITRCEAECTAADASYGSYVVNNDKLKLRPTAATTKTGEDLTAAPYFSMVMFEPVDGDLINYGNPPGYPGFPVCWDWQECMSHALRYISDNNINGMISDWYEANTVDNGLINYVKFSLTSGYLIRNPQDVGEEDSFVAKQAPSYDFFDLWQNMAKKYDLWSAIELYYDGTYRLRVEPREYFFDGDVLDHYFIQDLIQTSDQTQLFGGVKVGSEEVVRGTATNASIPYLLLLGFTEESYHVPIQCNTDQQLDLVNNFIIDSNVIERSLIGNDETYDGDVFIIEYTEGGGEYLAFPGPLGASDIPPYTYNPQLLNANVLQRYALLGAVQYVANDTVGFRAEDPAQGPMQATTVGIGSGYTVPAIPVQAQFRYDVITAQTPLAKDPGNNSGNGTPQGTTVPLADCRFTAPSALYCKMNVILPFQIFDNYANTPLTAGKRVQLRAIVERYDSGTVLVETPVDMLSQMQIAAPASYFFETGEFEVYMNALDYLVVKYQFVINEAPYFSGSPTWTLNLRLIPQAPGVWPIWYTTYIEGIGGTVLEQNLDEARTTLFKYFRSVPLADWTQLTGDHTKGVNISPDDRTPILGHVRKATRTVNTGAVEWELIAPTNQTFIP